MLNFLQLIKNKQLADRLRTKNHTFSIHTFSNLKCSLYSVKAFLAGCYKYITFFFLLIEDYMIKHIIKNTHNLKSTLNL